MAWVRNAWPSRGPPAIPAWPRRFRPWSWPSPWRHRLGRPGRRPRRRRDRTSRCQRPSRSPHRRPSELPRDGHDNSPGTATKSPRGRPLSLPRDGHGNSPRTATISPRLSVEGHHPLAGERVCQAHRLAVGDDDVGVVHEPVDQGRGDGLVHELVEARRGAGWTRGPATVVS